MVMAAAETATPSIAAASRMCLFINEVFGSVCVNVCCREDVFPYIASKNFKGINALKVLRFYLLMEICISALSELCVCIGLRRC